jgi:D-alanyl-D-alanine carboxypeptidase
MSCIRVGIVVPVVGLFLLVAPSAAAAFTPAQEAQMRQAVEEYASEAGYPGLVAGVWQRGVGSFVEATGIANLQTGAPLGAGGHYRIGSNTKTMTATLLLQLVNRGRLHLQDAVSEYVDGVPKGRRITLAMLLNHTSGIHDYRKPLEKKFFSRAHRNWRPRQIIRRNLRRP